MVNKSVTVLSKAEAESEILKNQSAGRKQYCYNPKTGILITDNPKSLVYPILSKRKLIPLEVLYDEKEDRFGIYLGRQRRKNGRTLPFGYLKVNLADRKSPSGTLVFDRHKVLIGILYTSEDDNGYVTPIQVVLREFDDFNRNGLIATARIGLLISSGDSIPIIESVRPESVAFHAGLKKNDVILKIGDISVENYLETVEAFFYLINGQRTRFTVFRNGRERVFFVEPKAL